MLISDIPVFRELLKGLDEEGGGDCVKMIPSIHSSYQMWFQLKIFLNQPSSQIQVFFEYFDRRYFDPELKLS